MFFGASEEDNSSTTILFSLVFYAVQFDTVHTLLALCEQVPARLFFFLICPPSPIAAVERLAYVYRGWTFGKAVSRAPFIVPYIPLPIYSYMVNLGHPLMLIVMHRTI